MKRLVLVMVLCLATPTAFAQPPGGSGGQRPPMTPEQQAALAAKRQAEMTAPRPIEALDSVWTEDLTWMDVRDVIKEGKTTALILTDMGKMIVELRTRLTVDAIHKTMAAAKSAQVQ